MSNYQKTVTNVCRAFHTKLNMYAFLFMDLNKRVLSHHRWEEFHAFHLPTDPLFSHKTNLSPAFVPCNTIFKSTAHSTKEKMTGIVKHTNVSLKCEIKT